MAGYIPSSDAEKIAWLANFNAWVAAHGAGHGLSPAEIAELNTETTNAETAFSGNVAQQAAAKAATAHKNNVLGEAIALARDLAQRIQHDPNTTDEDRGEAGLTIPDDTPTKSGDDDVLTITPPDVHLNFGTRQQVIVHWGPTPQDEHRNGRPPGVIGCEIQYCRGGIPANEADWQPLDTDTDSPYVHTLHESEPTTYAYRARYLGKGLKHGPFGDPAVCTVSV